MIELELGELVRWINPKTGGWELGRYVDASVVGQQYVKHDRAMLVLVAGTFGGLYFVDPAILEPVPDRSAWDKP